MSFTGDQILAERKRRRMSRRQFVDALGPPWTESKLNNVEMGRRAIKPPELEVLTPFMTNGQAQPQQHAQAAPVQYSSPQMPSQRPASSSGGDTVFLLTEEEHHFLYPESSQPEPIRQPFQTLLTYTTGSLTVPQQPTITLQATQTYTTVTSPPEPMAPVVHSIQPVGKQALYDEQGIRRLSNSEIQTFKHCRRRWWLSWYRGLRLKAQDLTGLAPLGTRVHDALAGWYVPAGQTPVHPSQTLEELIARDEARLLEATRQEEGADVAAKLTEFKKEAELARAMVEGYMEWIAETGADAGYQVVAPEEVLSAIIDAASNHRFKLQGRLDVRLARAHDGTHLFMDHKTVGSLKDPVRTLPLDEQMKTYHLLELENGGIGGHGEDLTDGALYNMLRRVKRTATANPPFYERIEVRHNSTTIQNFRERLKGEALTINHVEKCLDEGVDHQVIAYPTPSRDCVWKCEFTTLCSMLDDGSRAEDFIQEYYVAINPMDRYDDEVTNG